MCQLCGNYAPLLDEDGLPFLEVHHIILLAEGGDEVLASAVALCPNRYRRCHHVAGCKRLEVRLGEKWQGLWLSASLLYIF